MVTGILCEAVPTYKLFLPSEGWKIGASTPQKNANVAGMFVKGASLEPVGDVPGIS